MLFFQLGNSIPKSSFNLTEERNEYLGLFAFWINCVEGIGLISILEKFESGFIFFDISWVNLANSYQVPGSCPERW